jgi:hypothetical protein
MNSTVTIKWTQQHHPSRSYPGDGLLFCWLGTPRNKTYQQSSTWHGCRETFTGELKRQVTGTAKEVVNNKIDTRRLRIAVMRRSKVVNKSDSEKKDAFDTNWMCEAMRILNLFEKKLGWSLTSVAKVKGHSVHTDGSNIFVFAASCKWLRSPQLLSLYLLLLRLCRNKSFKKMNNFDDLPKVYDELLVIAGSNEDAKHFVLVYKYLHTILENCDELFFQRTIKTAYTLNQANYGITSMICGIADPTTINRFEKLKKNTAAASK